MENINILDCTLRDGGIINGFKFGEDIYNIIHGLVESKINIIECGYLEPKIHRTKGQTQLNSVHDLDLYCTEKIGGIKCCLMINNGCVDISSIENRNNDCLIDTLRIAFHKKNLNKAIEDSKALFQKGYNVCLNAMGSSTYTEDELNNMLGLITRETPFLLTFSIVDSYGCMLPSKISETMKTVSMYLNEKTNIGFHGHNNMQLAFANAIAFINVKTKQKKIIDSTLFGMGKGAGNLPTELITTYTNRELGTCYSIEKIYQLVDLIEKNYSREFKWGYSINFLVTAFLEATTMYATYFDKNYKLSTSEFYEIMNKIDTEDRYHFHELKAQRALRDLKKVKDIKNILNLT